MKEFVIVCTCLTQEYHKQLPAVLLDKGYTISPGLIKGSSCQVKGIVTNIIYKLTSSKENSNEILEDFEAALTEIKAYYYSVVVFPAGLDGVVTTGNINGETDPARVLQIKALW